MIRVGVVGAAGRMGRTVCEAVEAADDMEVLARVDLGDSLDLLDDCDVVVDFTADPIPDLAQTVFWVRLSEPRPEVSIEIRPVGGDPVAVVALPLEAGAGFVVWDGIVTNGAEAPAGAYVARVFGEGVDARVEFVR